MRSSKELMLSLIDDILDEAKLSEGKFELRNHDFSLSAFMNEIKNIFSHQMSLKGIVFTMTAHFERRNAKDAVVCSDQN